MIYKIHQLMAQLKFQLYLYFQIHYIPITLKFSEFIIGPPKSLILKESILPIILKSLNIYLLI